MRPGPRRIQSCRIRLAEQRHDRLRRLSGNRQRLNAELLLDLEGLQLRGFLGEVGVDEIADTLSITSLSLLVNATCASILRDAAPSVLSEVFRFVWVVVSVSTIAWAAACVLTWPVAATVITVPPRSRPWFATDRLSGSQVPPATPSCSDCRAATVPPPAFSRLVPLKSDELTMVVMRSRRAVKS